MDRDGISFPYGFYKTVYQPAVEVQGEKATETGMLAAFKLRSLVKRLCSQTATLDESRPSRKLTVNCREQAWLLKNSGFA
jgi:hypothetical protein